MGQTTRPGTTITDFWPDDTDTKMYLVSSNQTLAELLEAAQRKWPEASLENILIEAEYIHTHCLYYDRYDPSDYTLFVSLTYTQKQ